MFCRFFQIRRQGAACRGDGERSFLRIFAIERAKAQQSRKENLPCLQHLCICCGAQTSTAYRIFR